MKSYSLSHLSDHTLLRDLAALVARDRMTTAGLLAHIAEVDARKLYLPAAYPSMYAYCVGELRMSEDIAYKRIRAARAAREFPALYGALADGWLNLTSVVMLAPHLTPDTVAELLTAAAHKTNTEIERLLAERFPRPDVPTEVQALAPSAGGDQLAVRPVATLPPQASEPSPSGREAAPSWPQRVAPLAPERYGLQVTIGQGTHDKLRYAQALLGHQVASSDVAAVLDRALDALIHRLEKRKFGATAKPHPGRRNSTGTSRYVPAHVRCTVWARDQGQCTFVSETGRRCSARKDLEFDHVVEVARGGEATVAGLRLRCRPHNQYGAECTFGAEFMRRKRLAAAETRAAGRVRVSARAAAQARPEPTGQAGATTQDHGRAVAGDQAGVRQPLPPVAHASEHDVVPWLRALGFSAAEARRAAALCEDIPDASLEERLRRALSCFHVRGTRVIRPVAGPETATRSQAMGVPAAC